jgi:DNA-binding protein YbaB
MLDKVKQLNELRKLQGKAKELERQLKEVKETREEGEVEVTVTGDQKIVRLVINGEERKDVMDTVNKAMKEVQKKAAKKMMEMGGGLGGLLGGM